MDKLAKPSRFGTIVRHLSFIFLFSVSVIDAGPANFRNVHSCATHCTSNDPVKFMYESGTLYTYEYTTQLQTLVLEETAQRAKLKLSSKVEIHALSACDYNVQLKEVEVSEPSSEGNTLISPQHIKQALEKHSIQFAFHDGQIEHLCSHSDEPSWVTNIKSGILSMFQNTMENWNYEGIVQEIDINGKCPTQYSQSGSSWGGAHGVTKFKDLSTCTNRRHHISTIQSVPYASNPENSLLSGTVQCTQTILQNKIERVECNEEQIFKPFDDKSSGARNVISQALRLLTSYPHPNIPIVDAPAKRTSLIFETDAFSMETSEDFRTALKLLKELEDKTIPNVHIEAPSKFRELILSLRPLNEAALRSLLNKVDKQPTGKILLDAMPFINTAPSLVIMTNLYLNENLDKDVAQSWLSSVTFIKHPRSEMISALMPLFNENPTTAVLLSVSSVINSYCKSSEDCRKDEMILKALRTISQPLGNSCDVSEDDPKVRSAIVALKALGNIGLYPETTNGNNVLEQCFIKTSNAIEVRLAAIEAHRRVACSSFSITPFLELYADYSESTEVRIHAYLTSMKCGNRKVLEVVEDVLMSEVVNQVGSFVWTHLKNLQESTRLEKQAIKSLLSNEILQNKFQTDARKFSRNYESTMFSNEYKIGAGVDANVIFTEESFLPKSAMGNFSIQFLGETVNLAEFGGRFTSPESLLEPLFGPDGYFPDDSMASFLNSKRQKRDTSSKNIARLSTVYDAANSKPENPPAGSFYARLFGHEVLYKDFEVNTDSAIPNVVDESGRKWFSIKTIMDNLSTGKKSDFIHSAILMDIDYAVPTMSGIPLMLSLQAGSTVGLTAEGKFNVGKFLEKKELDIYGLLRPNFAVSVDASLTVRLGPGNNFIQSGLSVRNVLRSSTAIEAQVEINSLRAFKASFNLPQARQDILDASSKVLILKPSGQVEALNTNHDDEAPIRVETSLCFGNTSNWSGLKLCGEMSVPKHFTVTPLSPVIVKLYAEKTDDFYGYSIDYSLERRPSNTQLNVVFDTPGSQISRRTALHLLLSSAGSFQAFLNTPMIVLDAKGELTRNIKSLDVTIVNSGEQILQLNSSLTTTGNKIIPNFFLALLKKPVTDLKGTIQLPTINGNTKTATVNVTLKHVTESPIRLQGKHVAYDGSSEVTLGIESYFVTGKLVSNIKNRAGHWSSRSMLEYSWKHGEINTVDISAKLQRFRKGALSKFSTAASFIMSKYPDQNLDFSWETTTSNGFCENVAKFSIGKSVWDAHTLYNLQNNRDLTELRLLLSLNNPRNEVDYHLEFSHRMLAQSINTKFIGRTSSTNEMTAKFQYAALSRPLALTNVSAEITWPGNEYSFQSALIEKRKGEFDGEVLINLNNFKEMKATISYINNSNNLKLDHLVEFRARGFFPVPVSGNIGFSVTDKQSHIGCQVLIEGKKPYSSRLSTSVDYSHIKNTHKIEGKVTFNEKKYSSEVIFGKTKTGSKHLTVDLFLNQHISLEAKITGEYPETVTASVTIIPNKENHPNDKIEVTGLISSDNVQLRVSYFEEKVEITGKLDENAIAGELFWGEGKRISASAKLSTITLAAGYLSLQLSTPFENFKDANLIWNHEIKSDKWAGKLAGSIDEKSFNVQFTTGMAPNDLKIRVVVDLPGYSRKEWNGLMQKSANRNTLRASFLAGSKEGLIHLDHSHGRDISTFQVQLLGFESAPEFHMQWNHQPNLKHNGHLQLGWGSSGSKSHKVHFQFEKSLTPLSYNFSVLTPWSMWKSTTGFIKLDHLSSSYNLEMENDVNLSAIPKTVSVSIRGTLSAFKHLVNIKSQHSDFELSLSGHCNSMNDVNVVANIKTRTHTYNTVIKSQLENDIRKLEVLTDFDNRKSVIGVVLKNEGELGKNEITAWGTYLSGPEKKATILLEKDHQMRKFSFSVSDNSENLAQLETYVVWTGYRFWSLTVDLKSSVQIVPSISFESSHNMLDTSNILNINTFTISTNENSFWDSPGLLPVRNLSSQIVITNLQKIYSAINWDANDFNVAGEIKDNVADFDIVSSLFQPIKININYDLSEKKMFLHALVHRNGEKLLDAEMNAMNSPTKTEFAGSLTSAFFPAFDSKFVLDRNSGSIETFLKSDRNYIFHLNFLGKVTPLDGAVKIQSKSSIFPSINNILLDTMYKVEGQGGINFNAKYQNRAVIYHIKGYGVWGEEKLVRIITEGNFVSELEISMKSFNKVIATVSYNKVKLGEIHVTYDTRPSNFAWGHHIVGISFTNGQGDKSEGSISVLADPTKFDIGMTTPFSSWSIMRLYADIDLQSVSKAAKFGIHKDQDKLDCSFDFKSFKRNETSIVGTEITIHGFQTLRGILLETTEELKALRNLSMVEGKFSAWAKWSQSSVDLKIATPIDRWRNLKFTGNLANNRNLKTLGITCDVNGRHHEFRASVKLGKNKLDVDFSAQCIKTYTGKFVLDYTKNYKVELRLQGATVNWKIDGTLFDNTRISVEATTPIRNYERLQLQGNYNYLSDSEHHGNVLWKINGNAKEAGYTFQQQDSVLMIGLKTPFTNWETVNVQLDYDELLHNINFKAERNDGQTVLIGVSTKIAGQIANISTDGNLHVNVKVESPFQQYRKMLLSVDYNRVGGEHTANIEYNRNDELLKLNGHFLYNHRQPHAVEIKVDLSSLQNYSSKVQATLSVDPVGNSSFAAVVVFNEAKHEVNAVLDLSENNKAFCLKTTLPFLRTVKMSLKTGLEVGLQGLWEGEDQVLDVQTTFASNGWANQRLNLSVISPFDGLKHIFLEGALKVSPKALTFSIMFENEYSRWLGKMDGKLDGVNGQWNVQLNTPVKGYQDVNFRATHSWSPELKMVTFSVEKSSAKFVDLNVSLKQKGIQLTFDSEILEYQVSLHSSLQWSDEESPINIQMSISAGDVGRKTNLEVNIQGLSSGMLHLRSSEFPKIASKLAWKLDGNLNDGNAWGSLTNQVIGSRSIRSVWRVNNWKQAKLEMWLRVDESPIEKGGMLHYSVSPLNNNGQKLHLQSTWSTGKTPDTFSVIVKETQQGTQYNLEIETESSFTQLTTFLASLSMSLAPHATVKLNARHNGVEVVKIDSSISMTLPSSRLSLDFNIPVVCRPLQVLASYDISAEKKPLELMFKQADYLIWLLTYLTIPTNKQEIEFNFNMSCNVSSMKMDADGLIKGSYQFQGNGLSQITLSVKSEKIGNWNLVGALRPRDDFYANFEVNSTTPESIPPVFIRVNWRGSFLQSISSSVLLKFRDVKLHGNFSLTQDSVRLTVTTPLEWCKEINLEGFFHLQQEFNNFEFKLQAFNEEYKILGHCNISKSADAGIGLVSVSKGTAEASLATTLHYSLDRMGNLAVTGTWWGDHKMQVKGAVRGVEDSLWTESGKINFVVIMDGVETISVESFHKFKNNEYLLNLTSGTRRSFKVHVLKDANYMVASSIQWDSNDRMKFLAEIMTNKFDVFFSSPWTSDIAAHGMFEHDASQTIIDTFAIYNMQKSTARLECQYSNDSVKFNLMLEIPTLHQKLVTTLLVQSPSANQSGGTIDVHVNGRHFGLTGELSSRVFTSAESSVTQKESKLLLSLTIPTKGMQTVATEFLLRRPLQGMNSVLLNGGLTFGSETALFSIGYDLPPKANNDLGVTFFLQNSFRFPLKYGFTVRFASWNDARISLTCFSTTVDLIWKLKLSDLQVSLQLVTSPEKKSFNNYDFTVKGYFDPSSRGVNISVDANCKGRQINGQYTLKFETGAVTCEAMISSTEHSFLNHVYRFEINKTERGKYLVDFSGMQDTISFEVNGEVTIIGTNGITVNGKILGSLGTLYGHLEYSKRAAGAHEVQLTLESPSLIAGKKVIIKAEFSPKGNGFEANVQCRTRTGTHISSLKIIPTPLDGNVEFVFDTPHRHPAVIQLIWKKDGPRFKTNVRANFEEIVNELEAFLDVENLEGMVKILSPLIPSSHFEVHLKSLFNSAEIDILGDVHIREYRWKFEGALKHKNWRDMVALFNLLTPHKTFDRLTLAIKSSADEIYGEIYTPIIAIPKAMLKITGVEAIQKGNWHDIHPGISIGLPFGKYSASCIYKTLSASKAGKLHLFFENGAKSIPEMYEILTEISPLSSFNFNMNDMARVFLKMSTPMKELPNVEFELQGKVRGKSVIQLVSNGKLNEDKVSFTFDYDHNSGNPTISSKLVSPFDLYENVAFSLSFDSFQKIGNGRSLHMTVENPEWMDKVTLNADYRYQYNGFLEMESEVNAALVSFMDIPPVHFHLKTETESGFSGAVKGHVGTNPGSLTIDVKTDDENMAFLINGTLGEDNLYTLFVNSNIIRQELWMQMATDIFVQDFRILSTHATFSAALDTAGGDLQLSTPWGPLQSSLTLIPISPFMGNEFSIQQFLRDSNVTLDLHFDESRIVGLQFVSGDGVGVVELFNPIAPISLMLTFKRYTQSSLELVTELCWNLEAPVGNTVGIGISWNRGMMGYRSGLTLNLKQAGYLETQLSHSLTSSKFNQTVMLKWDSPLFDSFGQSGYQILVSKDSALKYNNYNSSIQIDLPWRSVVMDMLSNNNAEESLQSLVWRWDAMRDESKFVSIKWQEEIKALWRTTEISNLLEVSHPLADQPLLVSMERIYKNNNFQHIELEVKGSEIPQSTFQFSISRNNTWENFKTSVRHVPTNLHVTIDTKTSEDRERFSTELSYMDVRGIVRNLTLNVISKQDSYELTLFSKVMEQKTDIFLFKNSFYQDLATMNCRLLSYDADAILQTSLPFVELLVKQGGEDKLKVFGGYSHRKKIGAHIGRMESQVMIPFFMANAELTSTNALVAKTSWMPNLFDNLLDLEIPKTISSSFLSDIHASGALQGVSYEVIGRWEQLSPEVRTGLEQARNFVAYEARLWYEEWVKVVSSVVQLYDTNTFYIKDICSNFSIVADWFRSIRNIVEDGWSELLIVSTKFVADTSNGFNQLYQSYDGRLENLVIDYWTQGEEFVKTLWQENVLFVSSLFHKVWDASKFFLNALEGKIEEVERKLMAVGLFRKLMQVYKDYATWIDELPIQEFTKKIEEMMNIKFWDRLKSLLSPLIEAIRTRMEDEYFTELLETSPLPLLRYGISTVHSAFNKFWGVLEVEQRLKSFCRAGLRNADGLIHRYLPTVSLTYDIAEGFVQYNQSLSAIQWTDFTQLPRWRTAAEKVQDVSQVTNFYYQILDTMESLKPVFDLNIRSFLPPFGSYALMAGDYHFFTFDKRYFRFSGECSYLLVADLSRSTDTFSLVVNYENKGGLVRKKSYSITANGSVVDVEISDFRTTINGRKVELPLNVGSLFIRRHQSGLEMYDKRGFTMTCSLSSSVCTFGASGWHFGKLAGLLGTYDNEPINDFQSPDRKLINDVSAFAYSWRVGKNSGICRMKNFAKDEAEFADMDEICHNLLRNSSSPLRPCFNTVDAQVFIQMCKYDVSRNVNSANRAEAVCPAMNAYVTECQKNNVDVWMPPTCVRCRLEDGTALTTGENATFQVNGERQPPKSSDNVILIDESSSISSSTLTEAIKRLDLALHVEGIGNNRYAIIGYGGQGSYEQPHIKTNSAKVWAHNTLIKIPNDTSTIPLSKSANLYDAIHYAATLGFRAGVAKNFIAVTGGEEDCGDSATYADALTLLVENDIKLHLLVPKQFTLKGAPKDELNQIYGMDMTGVYTWKHAKSGILDPDPALKRQINVPKDFCTPLALESNGTRFNVEQPTKKVLDVWSRRVAQTSHPSTCQICECVPDKFGSASIMCHQCLSPSLWKFMEEWKSYQALDDGQEFIPTELLEQGDYTMS